MEFHFFFAGGGVQNFRLMEYIIFFFRCGYMPELPISETSVLFLASQIQGVCWQLATNGHFNLLLLDLKGN